MMPSDVVCLSDVCLSRTSVLSREQRPRKTKIGAEVAHVTRDSNTTFKIKRSKVKITGGGAYCGGLPHSLFMVASANLVIHKSDMRIDAEVVDCNSVVTFWRATLLKTDRSAYC